MNNLSKLTKLTILSIIAVPMILSSCKKKDEAPETPVTDPTGGITNIQGTTWTSIDPTFVANERIMGLATFENKLVVTFLNSAGNGDVYTSGHLSNGEISQHTLGYLMSGFGFEKAVELDGDLYGVGLMDTYGSFKFNKDYLAGNGGLPWDTYWYATTNQTGITKIGSEIIGSFGVSPYVKSKGGTVYPDVQGSIATSVNEVINFNGELICAGNFTSYNGTTLNNIARWDGSTWVPLGEGVNGEVEDLAVLNGELIIAGKFTATGDGNTDCRYIAKWNGTSWTSLGTGLSGGFNGALKLHVYGDQLFVGGDFTGAGSITSANIIKWKSGSWSALAGGASLPIGEITVFEGHLYIANAFNATENFLLKLQ